MKRIHRQRDAEERLSFAIAEIMEICDRHSVKLEPDGDYSIVARTNFEDETGEENMIGAFLE